MSSPREPSLHGFNHPFGCMNPITSPCNPIFLLVKNSHDITMFTLNSHEISILAGPNLLWTSPYIFLGQKATRKIPIFLVLQLPRNQPFPEFPAHAALQRLRQRRAWARRAPRLPAALAELTWRTGDFWVRMGTKHAIDIDR